MHHSVSLTQMKQAECVSVPSGELLQPVHPPRQPGVLVRSFPRGGADMKREVLNFASTSDERTQKDKDETNHHSAPGQLLSNSLKESRQKRVQASAFIPMSCPFS